LPLTNVEDFINKIREWLFILFFYLT
jgi:hypothetical protein